MAKFIVAFRKADSTVYALRVAASLEAAERTARTVYGDRLIGVHHFESWHAARYERPRAAVQVSGD